MTAISPPVAVLLIALGVVAVFGGGLLVLRLQPQCRARLSGFVLRPVGLALLVAFAALAADRQAWGTVACVGLAAATWSLNLVRARRNAADAQPSRLTSAIEASADATSLALTMIAVGLLAKQDAQGWMFDAALFAAYLAALYILRVRSMRRQATG